MILFKIKENLTRKVRTSLSVNDVKFVSEEMFLQLGLIEKVPVDAEEVYVFKEPFRVPKFNYLYGSKIKGYNDPYLAEAIQALLYLNPNPEVFLRRKIAEFIVFSFSTTVKVESEIKIGEFKEQAVLTYEDVLKMMEVIIASGTMEFWQPDTQDYVMYKQGSSIPRHAKIRLKQELRRMKSVEYFENAIHDATEYLIEEEAMLKITHSSIRDTQKVVGPKGPVSNQTIKKYMSPRTQRVLSRHNKWAPFKSKTTHDKYAIYLHSCDKTASLDDIAYKTSVSKSTAVQFRELRYGE